MERRAEKIPYRFPVTVHYIDQGLEYLRYVERDREPANTCVDLWRGMKDLNIPQEFLEEGGAEFAPMSTTRDLNVALRYALLGNSATLFCLKTEN